MSILTSTAISVDRLLALFLGLRFRHVVALRRVRAVIICIWLLSCALGGWKFAAKTSGAPFITVRVFMLLSLLISVFSYIKIYLRLRHHQLQVHWGHVQQAQPPNEGAIPLNIARYKKTVSSIAWVQLALLVCYLPFIFCEYANSIWIAAWECCRNSIFSCRTLDSLLKFISEPDSLLLEDQRSETSSEGHNQTIKLLSFDKLSLRVPSLCSRLVTQIHTERNYEKINVSEQCSF